VIISRLSKELTALNDLNCVVSRSGRRNLQQLTTSFLLSTSGSSSSLFTMEPFRGAHCVSGGSPLFQYCKDLCNTNGSWRLRRATSPLSFRPIVPDPVAGYKLIRIEAVIIPEEVRSSYEKKRFKMCSSASTDTAWQSGAHLEATVPHDYMVQQINILRLLEMHYHEDSSVNSNRSVCSDTFACFGYSSCPHGENSCRQQICEPFEYCGAWDVAGYYATINIEFAIQQSERKLHSARPLKTPTTNPDGGPTSTLVPIVMYRACVSNAWPVPPTQATTRITSDSTVSLTSSLPSYHVKNSMIFDESINAVNYDCIAACVNRQSKNYKEPVKPEACQYLQLIFKEASQLMPVAILWFQKE
jgi:hypothetical protein